MRMKVGDIEMSSNGIEFGSSSSHIEPTVQLTRRDTDLRRLLASQFGVKSLRIAASITTFVCVAATLVLILSENFVVSAISTIVVGASALSSTLLWVGARHRRLIDKQNEERESALTLERTQVLLNSLTSSQRPLTFESLCERLRWSNEAVVATLSSAVDSGEVIEDLDIDSGDWIYSAATESTRSLAFEPARPPTISERAEELAVQETVSATVVEQQHNER